MWCRARRSSTRCRCRISSAPASWCRSRRRNGSRSPTTIWRRPPARWCARATWCIVNTGWHKQVRGQRGLFLPRARLRAVGRRMVRREEGQGGRPRHPGQRPSARHRHRPAAQRPAASASRRGIQEMVGRPRLEGRLPGMGAGAPHPVQERHPRHRERRRRLDKVTGRRCTFAFFPWNWDRGDGCIIRLVAIVDPKGDYRIEKGEKF